MQFCNCAGILSSSLPRSERDFHFEGRKSRITISVTHSRMSWALLHLLRLTMSLPRVLFAVGCLSFLAAPVQSKYLPTWESLDSRPIPSWYDNAKFGIFIHWGVYAVPSFGSEWFWYRWQEQNRPEYAKFMKDNYPPGFQYADFAPMFKAEFYDPDAWADLLAKSGARYVVLTSKHHEGWTLWKSNVSWNWNAVDTGPHRDLVAGLSQAIRQRTNLTFGLYHSLFEWFHPLFMKDRAGGYASQEYVKGVLLPELHDMIETYKPEYLYSDGDVFAKAPDTYWASRDFLAWLYNESPVKDTVIVNDRWGNGCRCRHGGVFTCTDRYNPGVLQPHKWENAMTVDKISWGYRRNATLAEYMTINELLFQLVSTVSCGGNMLMNIGPTADGRIIPVFQERLLQMGEWLGVNGEAIYGTKPWRAQNDTANPDVWYTSKAGAVYAITLKWPSSGVLRLGAPVTTPATKVSMIGYPGELPWKPARGNEGIVIHAPVIPVSEMPCLWAWVFQLVKVE